MLSLNLPPFDYQLRKSNGKLQIFDHIRKKFVVLTPEEWVRQHCIHYLISHFQYPKALVQVETGLTYHQRAKRTDIVVYSRAGKPLLLVECKAPHIALSDHTFQQASVYNKTLQAPYLLITNGLVHRCCAIDWQQEQITFLKEIPVYSLIEKDS